MPIDDADWERRVAELWTRLDESIDFVARMDALVAERSPGEARGLYERGSAHDSVGRTREAIPLYQAALVDLGRPREAVAVSLTALSRYLPRYNRSVARYAEKIVVEPGG